MKIWQTFLCDYAKIFHQSNTVKRLSYLFAWINILIILYKTTHQLWFICCFAIIYIYLKFCIWGKCKKIWHFHPPRAVTQMQTEQYLVPVIKHYGTLNRMKKTVRWRFWGHESEIQGVVDFLSCQEFYFIYIYYKFETRNLLIDELFPCYSFFFRHDKA